MGSGARQARAEFALLARSGTAGRTAEREHLFWAEC
jgi:hypothetical protein